MSEIQIDHEAAVSFSTEHKDHMFLPNVSNLSRAYLDMVAQRDTAQTALAQQDKCLDDTMGQLIEANKQLAAERERGNAYAEEVRRLNNIMEGRDNA